MSEIELDAATINGHYSHMIDYGELDAALSESDEYTGISIGDDSEISEDVNEFVESAEVIETPFALITPHEEAQLDDITEGCEIRFPGNMPGKYMIQSNSIEEAAQFHSLVYDFLKDHDILPETVTNELDAVIGTFINSMFNPSEPNIELVERFSPSDANSMDGHPDELLFVYETEDLFAELTVPTRDDEVSDPWNAIWIEVAVPTMDIEEAEEVISEVEAAVLSP